MKVAVYINKLSSYVGFISFYSQNKPLKWYKKLAIDTFDF